MELANHDCPPRIIDFIYLEYPFYSWYIAGQSNSPIRDIDHTLSNNSRNQSVVPIVIFQYLCSRSRGSLSMHRTSVNISAIRLSYKGNPC